jgi:prefoldin subunit 5
MTSQYELLALQLHQRLGSMEMERAAVQRRVAELERLRVNVTKMQTSRAPIAVASAAAAAAVASSIEACGVATSDAPSFDALIDVGDKFFVEAKVDLNEPIAVHVGLGVFIAVPLSDADAFIVEQQQSLAARGDVLDASLGEARGHLELTEMMLQTVALAGRGM